MQQRLAWRSLMLLDDKVASLHPWVQNPGLTGCKHEKTPTSCLLASRYAVLLTCTHKHSTTCLCILTYTHTNVMELTFKQILHWNVVRLILRQPHFPMVCSIMCVGMCVCEYIYIYIFQMLPPFLILHTEFFTSSSQIEGPAPLSFFHTVPCLEWTPGAAVLLGQLW